MDSKEAIFYDKQCEPIVISKSLIDLLKSYNPKTWYKLYSLYSFYYYTAKWQGTNRIKSTTAYTAKGIGWTEETVRKYKMELVNLNLIENVQSRNEKHITGHFIEVKFIWSHEKVKIILDKLEKIETYPSKKPTPRKNLPLEKTYPLIKPGSNALSDNSKNALSDNSKNLFESEKKEPSPFSESFKLLPSKFKNREFISAWRNWFQYRKEIKKVMVISTIKFQIKKFEEFTSVEIIEMINRSITNGWIGLVFDKSKNRKEEKPKNLFHQKGFEKLVEEKVKREGITLNNFKNLEEE